MNKKKAKAKMQVIIAISFVVLLPFLYRYKKTQDLSYFLFYLSIIAVLWIIIGFITKMTADSKKYRNRTWATIDKMSGVEFEHYLAVQFERLGYRVSMTPTSNDYGADLILKKGRTTTVVQAKHYCGHNVNNSAVQEVVAAKAYYKADNLMVVTNSFYTKNAKNLARVNKVKLINRNDMTKLFSIK